MIPPGDKINISTFFLILIINQSLKRGRGGKKCEKRKSLEGILAASKYLKKTNVESEASGFNKQPELIMVR